MNQIEPMPPKNTKSAFTLLVGAYIFSVIVFSNVETGSFISKIIGVFFGISSLIYCIKNNKPTSREVIILWVFYFWNAIGLLLAAVEAIPTYGLLNKYVSIFQLFILFSILVSIIDDEKYFYYLVAIVAISTLVSLMAPFIVSQGLSQRVVGFSGNANGFGRGLLFGIIAFTILIIKSESKRLNFFYGVSIIALFYGALLSGSRQCFIAFVLFSFALYQYFVVYTLKRRRLLMLCSTSIALVVLLIIFFMLFKEMDIFIRLQRLVDWFSTGQLPGEKSASGRVMLIKTAMELFIQNPVAGIGIGQSSSVLTAISHNNYVELLLTTGLVGFLLYYSIFLSILLKMVKVNNNFIENNNKNEKVVWFLILMALSIILLLDIFSVSFMEKIHWIWMGLIVGYANIQKKKIT